MTNEQVINAIRLERSRQEHLKRDGKFAYSCADTELEGKPLLAIHKLPILAEECGEVAEECRGGIAVRGRLRTELIEVLAVTCAWLQGFGNSESDAIEFMLRQKSHGIGENELLIHLGQVSRQICDGDDLKLELCLCKLGGVAWSWLEALPAESTRKAGNSG